MPARHADTASSGSERSGLNSFGSERSGSPGDRSSGDRIEYVVRPCNDAWLIDHAGESYGPYKNCREATFFAIDAARKLGATGKNTRVRTIDQTGHLLTTWNYGTDR
jgi:hypothetical protein